NGSSATGGSFQMTGLGAGWKSTMTNTVTVNGVTYTLATTGNYVNLVYGAIAFPPALAIGSFLNVVASRLPLGRSVSKPRSACMHCGAEIRARDNVPLVSWLLLRGRCRDCGAKIGWRYPAVELATALLAAACFVEFGLTFHALAGAIFCGALVVIS